MTLGVYGGLPVFGLEPDWSGQGDMTLQRERWVAKALAAAHVESHQDETRLAWSWNYLLETQAEIQAFIEFFDSMMGRLGAFWMPSFCSDVLISAAFDAGDTTIRIVDIGYDRYWMSNECFGRHLFFSFPDGTFAFRKVQAAPAANLLHLDSAIGYSCPTGELHFVTCSFLLFCRFDSDTLELDYLLESAARCKMGYVTLPPGECPV